MVTDMDGNELTNLMDVCGNNLSASAAKSMIEKGEKVYKTATNATAATADAASDTEYKKLTPALHMMQNGHQVYKKGDILKTDVNTANNCIQIANATNAVGNTVADMTHRNSEAVESC
ncbi:MAG: hypothetical protein ACLTG0_10785 [Oscillibacter sp.]